MYNAKNHQHVDWIKWERKEDRAVLKIGCYSCIVPSDVILAESGEPFVRQCRNSAVDVCKSIFTQQAVAEQLAQQTTKLYTGVIDQLVWLKI